MPILNYKYNVSAKQIIKDKYSLTILVSNWECTFMVLSKSSNEAVLISHIIFAEKINSDEVLLSSIENGVHDLKLSQFQLDEVFVGILNQTFTLVPSSFANENTTELLQFVTGNVNEQEVFKQLLTNDSMFIFSIPQFLTQGIERLFNTVRFYHAGIASIQFQPKLITPSLYMLLVVHENGIELTVKENNQLLFYNYFEVQSNDDILYYVLYTAEQLNMDVKVHPVYLAMNQTTDSDLTKLLTKYIKQLNFITTPSTPMNEVFVSLPSHYFFSLKQLHTCV
jgi:hypothetical protein